MVHEEGVPSKETLYISGIVYQDDTLQFLAHEEGRIRYAPLVDTFYFDYFIKDHLENIRMVITEEQKSDAYPVASMETAQGTVEETFYSNVNTTRSDKPTGYPTDTYTNPNDKVAKLDGNTKKLGPAIVLKVMAGDKINIRVNSWYKTNGTTPGSPSDVANNVINDLINNIAGASGGKATATDLQNGGFFTGAVNYFLNHQESTSSGTKPRAYLTWMAFDEQFQYDYQSSAYDQVGINEEFREHLINGWEIKKNGYIYIYVSNETPNIDVFFDNLQVTHVRGPLLEETHYYPFGLTMSGISSKALGFGQPYNNNKFQGQEFASAEFIDGSGLDMYEFKWRMHDPQVGRFWQIDPLSDKYVYNSTYAFSENHVTSHIELEGLEKVDAKKGRDVLETMSMPTQWTPKQSSQTKQSGSSTQSKQGSKGNEVAVKTSGIAVDDVVGVTSTSKTAVTVGHKGILGDEATYTGYSGQKSGKDGVFSSVDISTTTNQDGTIVDGISLNNVLGFSLNFGTDGSITTGVGAFGVEAHWGININKGLGVTGGASYTNKDGQVSGGDLTLKAGGGTIAGVVMFIITKNPMAFVSAFAPAK